MQVTPAILLSSLVSQMVVTWAYKHPSIAGSADDFVCYETAGGVLGTLSHQTANCTVSSARFKENIASLPTSKLLEAALKLRSVSFNKKADGTPSAGFIAEEVARIVPDLVVYTSDYTDEDLAFEQANYPDVILYKDGKPLIPQTVDYMRVTYVLTGALQAQQAQLNDLAIRVSKLEKKMR